MDQPDDTYRNEARYSGNDAAQDGSQQQWLPDQLEVVVNTLECPCHPGGLWIRSQNHQANSIAEVEHGWHGNGVGYPDQSYGYGQVAANQYSNDSSDHHLEGHRQKGAEDTHQECQ